MKQSIELQRTSRHWTIGLINRTLLIIIVAIFMAVGMCTATAADPSQTDAPTKEVDPLITKHDGNGNGKIDVAEHKAFVRDRALRRRQEEKELASQRPALSRQERWFVERIKWDKATIKKYDANNNGRLEVAERAKAMNDAAEAARAKLREHDRNGNGKLDADEIQTLRQSRSQGDSRMEASRVSNKRSSR